MPGEYDEFANVFASLTEPGAEAAADKETEAAADAATSAADTNPAAGATETLPADSAQVQEAPSLDAAAEAARTTETPAADTSAAEPAADVAALQAKLAELEAQLAAAKQPPAEIPAAKQEPEAAPETQPEPIYTGKEVEEIEAYRKDWPDVAKAEALIRRNEYAQLLEHVFNEVNRVYGPLVQRAISTADTVDESLVLDSIKKTHQDYDEIYDDVLAWVKTLPSYARRGAEEVVKSGSVEDVIDLIGSFKEATGRNKPAAATTPPATPELTPAAKKAAAAMTPVGTKRSVASGQAADPNDFEAAWKEAASSET